MALSAEQRKDLQEQLQQAVLGCNDRCLYFAAKWYAIHDTIQVPRLI